MGFWSNVGQFFTGTPSRTEQRSTLGPEQMGTYSQLRAAIQGRGAGGAFGQAGDYYRDLMSNDSADFNAFAAPEMRRFNERIIPDLSEQFAGMGSGNLSSSGFRNAAVSAGTDLSERLGSIRAQLRQAGAQGLMGLGQQGLGQFNENIYHTAKPGFLDQIGEGIGSAIGGLIPNFGGSKSSDKGKSNPYGYSQDQFNNTANQYMRNRRFNPDENF